ncbi:hypothetical protein SERLADRAFT_393348, partial [Serpula lacrymans var. lacrymans S7.9]
MPIKQIKRRSNTILKIIFDSSATLKERQEFENWLSPLNFRQRQSEVRETWREGTGGWVLD